MSKRNPVTGKRRPVKPGDRLIYTLPPGPPAEAIERFGGDVQAAITAALSLLILMPQGPAIPSDQISTPTAEPEPVPPLEPLADVMTQPFFGDD